MKTTPWALAILAMTLTSGHAIGADAYDPYAPVPDVISYDDAPIWTGFYAGVHAGVGWLDTWDDGGGGINDTASGLGGIHAGYSHQIGAYVVGLEASFTLTSYSLQNTTLNIHSPWLASARARVGYAFEDLQVYAIGGFSYSVAELASTTTTRRTNDYAAGHVFGAGLEYLLEQGWSVGAEYLRHEFWEHDVTVNNTFRASGNIDEVRARLSYRF